MKWKLETRRKSYHTAVAFYYSYGEIHCDFFIPLNHNAIFISKRKGEGRFTFGGDYETYPLGIGK